MCLVFMAFLCCRIKGEQKNDTLFRFAHISDTHIGTHGADTDLQRTIDDINSQPYIEFVIVSGDITEFGSDEELLKAKSLFEKLNKPWHLIPGNHDTKWSESGGNSFRKIFNSETFSFEHKGFWFVGTNCGPNMRMGPGQVPRENLVWLDSVLRKHPDKKQPMFFVNHYPMDSGLNNWYEILDRLHDRNLKAVLCGHGHQNTKLNFEGVPGIMGRSNLRAKDSIGGYNIVTLTTDSLIYNERKLPSCEGGEMPKAWGGCSLDSQPVLDSGTKEQPPARSARRPPSQEGICAKTLPSWCSIAINKFATRDTNPKRPDYSANKLYPDIKSKWEIQEQSDIGSGIGVYKQTLIYTTTGGSIKSVQLATGKPIWTFQTNGKIYATPLVMKDLAIVPSTDGNIYCLNAGTGKLVWKMETGRPIVSSAAGIKDRIFVAGSDGHCRALDLNSGKVLWDHSGINNFVETRPLVYEDKVYFGSWGNEFYALDIETGKTVWAWNRQTNRMFSAAACWPVIAGNKLFVVAPDRQMTALNKDDGSIIWRNYDSLNWCRESMGISNDRKQVYVKTLQGKILAIDAEAPDRKVNWLSPVDLGFEIDPAPINESGDIIFIPSHSGAVYALNKINGALIWQHKISNCLINTVHPIDQHTLITSAMDGKLVCLQY